MLRRNIFTFDALVNNYVAPSQGVPEDVKYNKTSKHSASIMALGVIALNGLKGPTVFVEFGVKISTQRCKCSFLLNVNAIKNKIHCFFLSLKY